MKIEGTEYQETIVEIVGLEIPDHGTTAFLLIRDSEQRNLALAIDLEAALRSLEYSSQAVGSLGLREAGGVGHIPVKRTTVAALSDTAQVALAVEFGTIGILPLTLSRNQAAELESQLSSAAFRLPKLN